MSTLTIGTSVQQNSVYQYISNVAHALNQLMAALFSVEVDEQLENEKLPVSSLKLNQMAAELENDMPSLSAELRVIAGRA